jgi:hypothetical protein
MANDGTALGALNEIIESAGGTPDAATLVPAIEQLGEVIGSGGGGGGIADGSVTTAKLANGAVNQEKLDSNAVTLDKIDGSAVREMHAISLVAADSQTNQALALLGFPHKMYTPAEMMVDDRYADHSVRLCWISGTTLEVAPIDFYGNLQTQAITLYAKGSGSMVSGILGVDESWTIAANA